MVTIAVLPKQNLIHQRTINMKQLHLPALLLGLGMIVSSLIPVAQAQTSPRIIHIAVVSSDRPKTYIDDNGEITGFDVEVLKKVNTLLPQYKFVFDAMDYESMLVGVESGKYQIASNSLLKTPSREAKLLFPQENIGVTLVKMVVRADQVGLDSLDDAAKTHARLVPIPANWGTYAILTQYNKDHPQQPLVFGTIEALDRADAYKWLVSGRYDAFLTTADGHKVTSEALGYQNKLKLTSVVKSFKTYSVFNKKETVLAADVDGALKTLKDENALADIATRFLGENVFANQH